jgi:hypothetical protein
MQGTKHDRGNRARLAGIRLSSENFLHLRLETVLTVLIKARHSFYSKIWPGQFIGTNRPGLKLNK